jgi:hypothetical protein
MLSFFYRLLSRFKTQDDLAKDMRATFEEARRDAWAQGWWSYTAFAIREIGGLFGRPAENLWWLRTAGWCLAGLTAGGFVSYLLPARYTSEATLRLVPAMMSPDLLPNDTVDIERLLDSGRATVLSRNVITDIVYQFDLYPSSRQRHPMEEIVEEFQKSARIERYGTNLIRVAFTYGDSPSAETDRRLVNKVVQDLVSRVIEDNIRERSNMVVETVQFFQDQLDTVGWSWLKQSASVKATPVSDPRYELLELARDQKRKEYESVAQKLGIAETLRDLENRGQGIKVELLDAATLPQRPDTASSFIWLVGFGCGLAVGLMTALWRALRGTPPPDFAVPGAAEAA